MTQDDQIRERVENALMEAADAANGLGSINKDFEPSQNFSLENNIVQSAIQLALMGMFANVGGTDDLKACLENIRIAQGLLVEAEGE